jgi:hypothetical protein
MSISQNFPDEGPSLNLNFASSRILDPRITFTRTSTGTYLSNNGLVTIASANTPRFDHSYNGSNVESLGLLIEESRTNLTTYSEDISQYQGIDNASVSTNQITSPDGTTTADKLTSTISGGTNNCWVQKYSAVAVDTATYTFSIFLKAGTSPQTIINLQLAGGTYQQSIAIINWTSNTITSSSGGTSALTAYPNGWYRVSITLTNNGTNNAIYPRVYVRGQGTDNVNGEFVYNWGWQTEAGSFPTSYIPTVASTVTRSADNAFMTGTNFSSWYNQTEGTILTNIKYDGAPISGVMNRIAFYLRGTGSANTWHGWWESVNTGGTINYNGTSFDATLIQSGTTISQGSRVKLISAIKTNDFAFSQNGGTVQTDTSVILPITHTIIDIGNSGGGNYINGTISQLLYYPKRLTNSQLQNLTK